MNRIAVQLILAAGFALPACAQQSDHSGARDGAQAARAAKSAEGEVRKIDKGAKKITLKHGPIPSLDMAPMTMVYRVRDASLLDKVKPGDKVKFVAEKIDRQYTVTHIERAAQ
jgi:Cu/Ag efflux protein CusF